MVFALQPAMGAATYAAEAEDEPAVVSEEPLAEDTEETEAPAVQEPADPEPADEPAEPAPVVTATPYKGVYDGAPHSVLLEGVPEDAVTEYRTSEEEEWSPDVPERTDAGVTEVFYRVIEENGRTTEGVSSISIDKASLKSAKLSTTMYVYSAGVYRHPGATVYAEGIPSALAVSRDFKITYDPGCTEVGQYTATITGKGNYTGTIKKTFTVKPSKVKLIKRDNFYGELTLQVDRTAAASGGAGAYYQYAYRTAGGSWHYTTRTARTRVLSLTVDTTYYAKVRTVKKAGNKTYYGDWSGEYYVIRKSNRNLDRLMKTARTTRFAGTGWCAAWVCNVFDRSGLMRASRMAYASDYYRKYCTSSNRADLKPGMIVTSRYSSTGGYAGHIGIYIGYGKVISNERSKTIISLDTFTARYGHGYPIRWGWMNNKKLY